MNKVLKVLLHLALISAFCFVIYSNKTLFQLFSSLTFEYFIIFLTLILITWFVTAYPLIAYMSFKNLKIELFDNFLLTIKASLFNFLPLKPGLFIRSFELKKKNQLRHSDFISFLLSRMFFSIISQLLFLFILFQYFLDIQKLHYWFFLFFLFIILFYVFVYFSTKEKIKLYKFYFSEWLNDSLYKALQAKVYFIKILITNLLHFLLIFSRYFLAAILLNIEIDPSYLLFFVPVTIVSNYINVVPGNLILREFLIGLVAVSLGISFDLGFQIAMLDRLMLIFASGGSLLIYFLYKIRKKLI